MICYAALLNKLNLNHLSISLWRDYIKIRYYYIARFYINKIPILLEIIPYGSSICILAIIKKVMDFSSHPILLLDGGFSNELSKRCSYDVDKEPLWTAKALQTDKEAVIETHLEYLKAGADIIETATYQATTKGLEENLGLPPQECESLIENAVALASQAVTRFQSLNGTANVNKAKCKRPMIAGSIGPYGVYLHDGSEYSGSYMDKVTKEEIINLHFKRLEILGKSEVDLLALETMPSLAEVEILLELIKQKNIEKPVWVSFTLRENDPSKTAWGDSVKDAFKAISHHKNIWAFGTNCINPANVEEFLRLASEAKNEIGDAGKNIRLIVYPNVGWTWMAGQGWSEESVPDVAVYSKNWVRLGATVIGGCCQVGPEQIKKLRSCIIDD